MQYAVLVGEVYLYLAPSAFGVNKPICFLLSEICNAVKGECYRVGKGGLSGAVVPGDAVNVTERKAYRLLLVAKARKRDFFNAYFGYLFHKLHSLFPR